jgi:hypothetical protein
MNELIRLNTDINKVFAGLRTNSEQISNVMINNDSGFNWLSEQVELLQELLDERKLQLKIERGKLLDRDLREYLPKEEPKKKWKVVK